MLKKSLLTGLLASAVVLGALPASAAAEKTMKENKFMTLTGTASQVSGEEFLLTYGANKKVKVDLENWGDINASDVVRDGEHVTVSGIVEDNLFEMPEIDAQTIHALDAGRRYDYSSADHRVIEHDVQYSSRTDTIDRAGNRLITGRVADFNGLNFIMMTDSGPVSIDTAALPYNPADDDYMPKLEKGDTVTLRARSESGPYDALASEVVTITKSYGGKPMKQQLNTEKEPVGETALALPPSRRHMND